MTTPPRIIAGITCSNEHHRPERMHIPDDIWERGHLSSLSHPWHAMERWAGLVDELMLDRPFGQWVIANDAENRPVKAGHLLGAGQDGLPLYAHMVGSRTPHGDGYGKAVQDFPKAVKWIRSHWPRLATSLYIGGKAAWLADHQSWCPEAYQLKLGLRLDTVGSVADENAPCVRDAIRESSRGVPVTLENHVDRGWAHKFPHLNRFPRQSHEARCRLVESGIFLRAEGENVCWVDWKGSVKATADAYCEWLSTGRWSIIAGFNSEWPQGEIQRVIEARDAARANGGNAGAVAVAN